MSGITRNSESDDPKLSHLDAKQENKLKKTILTKNRQKNTSVDFLDPAEPKETFAESRDAVSHLTVSLRANYHSFVTKKQAHDPTFFGVARIALPNMHNDSPFKCIEPFVHATKAFLGGIKQEDAIIELQKLENEVQQQYLAFRKKIFLEGHADNEDTIREKILLQILIKFEKKSGFSEAVVIAKDAGPKKDGLITPGQFNKLVFGAHPFLDYGATTQHGPHSHRVQWYILAQHFKKNTPLFFNADNLEQIRKLIIQFKILPSTTTSELTDDYIRTHFISILYRMYGIPEFNKSFDWGKFKMELKETYAKLNPDREVPRDMSPPHVWPQLYDNRGYDGDFRVPSGFGFLQSRGAFPLLPILGRPNVDVSRSLKTILDVTKPIPHNNDDANKLDYLDLAVSRRPMKDSKARNVVASFASSNSNPMLDKKNMGGYSDTLSSTDGSNSQSLLTDSSVAPSRVSAGTTASAFFSSSGRDNLTSFGDHEKAESLQQDELPTKGPNLQST